MPALRERLQGEPALRRKLFQVEFLSTLAGDTLVTLVYHRNWTRPGKIWPSRWRKPWGSPW